MTIVEFLAARYDEIEALALAVKPAGRPLEEGPLYWFASGTSIGDSSGYVVAYEIWGQACREHIAYHDPVRVLADIAAKRAILARHEGAARSLAAIEAVDGFNLNAHALITAVHDSTLTAVRHHASVHADHPDYDPRWKP